MNLSTLRTPPRSSFRLALLCAALGGFPDADATRFISTTNAAEPPRAVWTPPSFDEFSADLRFVDALVARRLIAQADAELARLETGLADAPQVQRFQFARVAVRAAVESSRLLTADERAAVAARIAAVRAAVESGFAADANPLRPLDFDVVFGAESNADAALGYAAALVRAFYELGVLDVESNDATSTASPSDATDELNATSAVADSPFLIAAFETASALVRRLPPEKSRFFVYWSAKALLARAAANADAEKLYRQATQAAKALCADADKRRDAADYFFARLLLVEAARRQGDAKTTERLIEQTLNDAAKAPNADDAAPQELAVALVAEEIRLLSLESKPFDAAKLASTDVDLLNRPTPTGPARFADRFFDVFADRDFARVAAFLNAASALAESETSENAPTVDGADVDANSSEKTTSDVPGISTQDALAAARAAADRLPTSFWRARASLLLREISVASADWRTTEAVAEERFRADDWEAALAEYDRASEEAQAAGADADAFRLAATAAGIVDKILRDKLFESNRLSSNDADFWRRDAARRFEAAARSRPDDELAPRLFLLAIQRTQELKNAALTSKDIKTSANDATGANDVASSSAPDVATLRRDYLTLFPTAENRGAFANESARLALADGKLDDAALYVDAVSPDDSAFPETLALADALANARFAAVSVDSPDAEKRQAAVFIDAASRLLAKTTAASPPVSPDSPDSPAETPLVVQVKEAAQKLTAENSTATDDAVLTRLFELPRPAQIAADAELIAAFESLLDRWDAALADAAPERAALRADVQAKRLALRLDAGQTDAVLRDLANLEEATQSAGLETLERLLIFAEKAPRETQIKIGNAALASLDAQKVGQTAQNTQNTQNTKAAQEKRSLVRARALRLAGKTQESLTLFAQIRRQNPKNLDATLGIAEILTAQNEPKALEQAVRYWSDAADLVPAGSPAWWDAKERVVEIYVRTDRRDQARKMLRTLWLTRSDASDPNRRARWERLVGAE